jgi:hypothetical protein
MGFFSKRVPVCDVCGVSQDNGCPGPDAHVTQIDGDQPGWLPAGLREQAQGEWTFHCVRCNSFPAMKWPKDGGASAALMIHLGAAHHVGQFKDSATRMNPTAMIPVA